MKYGTPHIHGLLYTLFKNSKLNKGEPAGLSSFEFCTIVSIKDNKIGLDITPRPIFIFHQSKIAKRPQTRNS